MKINIGSSDEPLGRETYFRRWAPERILETAEIPRDHKTMRKNIDWLRAIQEQAPEKVILGAKGASSIDDLIEGRFTRDRSGVTQRIAESTDEIIVLPECYKLGGWAAQKTVAYDDKTLLRLDSIHSKRQLLGLERGDKTMFEDGRLSYGEIQRFGMTPEKLLAAAIAHEANRGPEKIRAGYAWKSPSNPALHVMSLIRCVEGLELRLLQDYAAWKVMPERLREQTSDRAQAKLRNIERYVRNFEAADLLPRLDLSERDLIERACRPRLNRRGWNMKVPSRRNPGRYHEIVIDNMPIFRGRVKAIDRVPYTWSVRVSDTCESEQKYREGRRVSSGKERTPVKPDVYFTASSVAAAHSVRRMHRYRPAGWFCDDLPIALPRSMLLEHADALRYRTVILGEDGRGEPTLRALGKTEIEDWLWPLVLSRGFDETLTMHPRNLSLDEAKNILKFYEDGERYAA